MIYTTYLWWCGEWFIDGLPCFTHIIGISVETGWWNTGFRGVKPRFLKKIAHFSWRKSKENSKKWRDPQWSSMTTGCFGCSFFMAPGEPKLRGTTHAARSFHDRMPCEAWCLFISLPYTGSFVGGQCCNIFQTSWPISQIPCKKLNS